MINVVFTGNIFHSDGSPANNVKYQGLFIKTNPNSSDSVWDEPRISETNQYNFNLGDSTWLSQQGGYSQPYDKVILCFWLDNTEDRNSTSLSEWCFIEWVLDERDVYVQDIQLMGSTNPTCSFSLSGSNPVYVYNTGSGDYHEWVYEGKEHYQSDVWDGFSIFPVNEIDDVIIQWGDGDYGTYPLDTPFIEHLYDGFSDYDITLNLTNVSGLECQLNMAHRVFNVVNNGLNWVTPIYLGSSHRFIPNITGDLVSITSVNYYIDGVLTYENLSFNDSFDHKFTTGGNHIIKQCINYDDGFDNKIQCEDFIVKLDSQVDFTSSVYDCGLVFTDISNIGASPIVKYQWDVMDGLFILAHTEGVEYSDWYYSWPYKGTFQVRLAITDSNDNIYSITKEYVIEECLGSVRDATDGGGSSPWMYTETKYVNVDTPLPTVSITDICVDDIEDKSILILEVIDYSDLL